MGNPRYKPEYAEEARKLCLLGLTNIELAEHFGVSDRSIYSWINKYPEFLQSLKEGREAADCKVADSLYQKALNGDTTAMIFWLKNRRRQSWRDKYEQSDDASEPEEINFRINE